MDDNPKSDVVRVAFDLAKTGRNRTLSDLERELRKAGFAGSHVEAHLAGRSIRVELRQLLKLFGKVGESPS